MTDLHDPQSGTTKPFHFHPDDTIAQFRAFASSHGLELPANLITDGKLQRFALPGDMPPVKNGAYMLHPMIANKNPSGNVRDFRGDDPAHIWVYKPPQNSSDQASHDHPPIDDDFSTDDRPLSDFGIDEADNPEFHNLPPRNDQPKPPPTPTSGQTQTDKPASIFGLHRHSLRGKAAEMEKQMMDDKFVLEKVAILGQITVIYAMPNTGKTLLVLWLLIHAIKSGTINPQDIYYINADDNYKGLMFKVRIAEEHGFEMLAPGHGGFKSDQLKGAMEDAIKSGAARGKIIVLDTLKKFTNLMDKKVGSGFMRLAREFVSNGGTMILLAHTNKKRDDNGKAIFGGTSDVVDDCDCAYILDEANKAGGVKRVLFENIKSRGDVASQLAFDYAMGVKHYGELLNSVKMIDMAEEQKAEFKQESEDQRGRDMTAINAIKEALRSGVNAKTKLVSTAKALAEMNGAKIGRPKIEAVLIRYAGTKHSDTCFWRTEKVDDNNATLYYELKPENYTADEYKSATNGE